MVAQGESTERYADALELFAPILSTEAMALVARDLSISVSGEVDPLHEDEALIEAEVRRLRIRKEAQERFDAAEHELTVPPPFEDLGELLSRPLPPLEWRIGGVMPRGSRTVFSAPAKAGKTSIITNLVKALADGAPFLGRFEALPPVGNIGIVDLEMHERTLLNWYQDLGLQNPQRVLINPLRGMVSAFNVLNPSVFSRWVAEFQRCQIETLIVDCARPLLDALGLNEHNEAGILLDALGSLAREADISELVVVHHMGHNGERSRGDTRFRDWPDQEWILVRQDDAPGAPRYFRAVGRDVDLPETRLDFDQDTRLLTLVEGTRQEAGLASALNSVSDVLLASREPMTGRAIERALESKVTREAVRDALKQGVERGTLVRSSGPKRSYLYQCASAPAHAGQTPAHNSECAAAYIGGALAQTDDEGSAP